MFGRNADTGIADNQAVVFCVDRYTAAGNIVLDGIVAEIVKDLLEHSADTLDRKAITSYIDRNILLSSAGGQNLFYIFCQRQRLPRVSKVIIEPYLPYWITGERKENAFP